MIAPQVYLLSSRTFLEQQKQQLSEGVEGEKLRGALVLTQESAALQILLEAAIYDQVRDFLLSLLKQHSTG